MVVIDRFMVRVQAAACPVIDLGQASEEFPMEIANAVRRTDLLGGLSPESLDFLTADARVRRLERGERLFTEGDTGTAVYVLTSGSIRLYRSDRDGREAVLHMVRPGELFAEVVLFEADVYPVSAEAREDSEVVGIQVSRVRELLEDPAFRREFLATVMRKVRFLGNQIFVLSSCDVRERLVRFLEQRYGRRSAYDIELTKKEVAAAIATTPETLSRVLARMEADGVLSWKGDTIRCHAEVWTTRSRE